MVELLDAKFIDRKEFTLIYHKLTIEGSPTHMNRIFLDCDLGVITNYERGII